METPARNILSNCATAAHQTIGPPRDFPKPDADLCKT